MARARSLLASAFVLALVGCTAAPTAVGPLALDVTFAGDPADLPMAIAIVAFEPALIVTGLEPTDVAEIDVGQYVLDTAWFDRDGRMTLELPAPADLPAGLRLPAADALRLFGLPAGCTVAVDGAATVSGFAYGPPDAGGAAVRRPRPRHGPAGADAARGRGSSPRRSTPPPLLTFVYADGAGDVHDARGSCADARRRVRRRPVPRARLEPGRDRGVERR